MDAAACIGCGACVAACKNASAMLFVAAKVSHLGSLPQGQPERRDRVLAMVAQHDREGFGHCTNYYECEAACPKEISVEFIAQLNRDYIKGTLEGRQPAGGRCLGRRRLNSPVNSSAGTTCRPGRSWPRSRRSSWPRRSRPSCP